ncbi:hypothetical protein MRB53_012688 [Persea americana]|uniref:Uncharacterized protein n=1 Tax=Persea americana TaxID=3435 RepID=A0ACC2LZA9_PERAE|nr:hypothetical protein MRB53_012688 [Persea americana]
MQRMAKERERETGRRRIERQGRGRRGRRGRRKGGRRGCEMCAGGREDGRGVLGKREETTLCAGGEQRRYCAWVGAAACVWRRWEQANVSVGVRGEMEEGRRERDLERIDGGRWGRRDGEER